MTTTGPALLAMVYAAPLALLWLGWARAGKRTTHANRTVLAHNRAAGLAEPPGLHPRIDPSRCIGCGACVRACPESHVIGLIDRKATLVEPWACVGHGTCREACPTGAIALVFGTPTRGIDVPDLSATLESSVPGIYVAGELGGMGLIRNALDQGSRAVEAIAQHRAAPGDDRLDLLIVGCGPAGLAASLAAKAASLRFVAIDQASLGGSIAHFPRGKLIMTAPAQLPLIGEVSLGDIGKDDLLDFWRDVLERSGIAPHFEEEVREIEPDQTGGFVVVTDKDRYRTRTVLLATGRGGTPRRLGIPGEERSKVVYRLTDPGQYAALRVLVIGGGNSALEAALTLAALEGTEVTLAHRGSGFARALPEHRIALAALVEAGGIRVLTETRPVAIAAESVTLAGTDGMLELANDAVIVCAGGTLPTGLLEATGIKVRTCHGEL